MSNLSILISCLGFFACGYALRCNEIAELKAKTRLLTEALADRRREAMFRHPSGQNLRVIPGQRR